MAGGVRQVAREGHAEEAAEAETIWMPGCGTAKCKLCLGDVSRRCLKTFLVCCMEVTGGKTGSLESR